MEHGSLSIWGWWLVLMMAMLFVGSVLHATRGTAFLSGVLT